MCEQKGSEGMFSGIILGGLLGVALGILFAPLAGEETRNKLKNKLDDLNFDDIQHKFSEAFEAGVEEAKRTASVQEDK